MVKLNKGFSFGIFLFVFDSFFFCNEKIGNSGGRTKFIISTFSKAFFRLLVLFSKNWYFRFVAFEFSWMFLKNNRSSWLKNFEWVSDVEKQPARHKFSILKKDKRWCSIKRLSQYGTAVQPLLHEISTSTIVFSQLVTSILSGWILSLLEKKCHWVKIQFEII